MTLPTPIVHVIDDDDSFRRAVMRLLTAAGNEVRGYASVGEFLLRQPKGTPGCLVLDVQMPGPSGLDLQTALLEQQDSWPVIFLTGHGDIPMTARAFKAGAVDFLTKPVQRDALLTAVQRALDQDAESRAARERAAELQTLLDGLSPREREVFAFVVAGRLNKEIAADLDLSERTVKAHRARVMEKLHVTSVVELVRVADELRASTESRDAPRRDLR